MLTIRNIIKSLLLITLLTGCTERKFSAQDLKEVLPYTSYETVTSIPGLAFPSEEIPEYRIQTDNLICYFLEDKRSSLIIPDESAELLKYLLTEEQFKEAVIKYEKFKKDENVVASTYYYGPYEVWFIYSSDVACIQVYM